MAKMNTSYNNSSFCRGVQAMMVLNERSRKYNDKASPACRTVHNYQPPPPTPNRRYSTSSHFVFRFFLESESSPSAVVGEAA